MARFAQSCLAVAIAAACSGASPPAAAQDGEDRARFDTVVVTAGRTEQTLATAPASVTVITAAEIETAAADDFGDLMRNVPGLNVAQTNVRDINMTARGATSTLSNSQLVLLDGRSIYLDFFGIVMWDFLPIQAKEIQQIEVVRGPGSAVWGANAMTGVVNVITRRPRDIVGTSVVVGTQTANVVHAQSSNGFAYKLSAGYFEEDAYERPTGVVPGSNPPQTYPDFRNTGTVQKRANAVLDWDTSTGNVSLSLGSAATDGIIHTGIGPFDIERGALFSYVDADWNFGNVHASLALTKLDGDAQNLLTRSVDGQPLGFEFVTNTYDLELSSSTDVGTRHSLSYGGNIRTNDHELEIAPAAGDKDEWGVYLQDEIMLGERWRWVVGARYDDIDPLDDAVFTPRTSLHYTFAPGQTLRVSYNRAFRTPSAVNNYLSVSILQQADALVLPADAFGNPLLDEERLTAYEVGYAGVLGDDIRFTVDVYRNEIEDSIDFYVVDTYGPGNFPAPGPGVPAEVVPCFNFAPGTGPGACPFGGLAGLVPSDYSYRNIGRTVNRGIELALDRDLGEWGWFANLSWQDEPDITGVPLGEVNLPPEWRLNLGVDRDVGRYFWNVTLNYQDESFWSDVLFARAATESFTQVNAAFGWRFRDDRFTLKLIGQNLFDERVQQHIFGDIIERRLAGQITFEF